MKKPSRTHPSSTTTRTASPCGVRKRRTAASAARQAAVCAVNAGRSLVNEIAAYNDFFCDKILRLDTREYNRKFWRDACKYGHTGRRPRTWRNLGVASDGGPGAWMFHDIAVAWAITMELSGFPLWLLARVLDTQVRRMTRPKYYDVENERRRIFRAANRKIRRRKTTNPCPTPQAIREAFAHAKDSAEAMIRFGSMIDDLECYVDNSLIRSEDGAIVGRRGGIRSYILQELPDLYPRYKTIMRYRCIARNFRRACKEKDPVPAADLLAETVPPPCSQRAPKTEARQIARAIVAEWKGTIVSLVASIEMRLQDREKEFALQGLPPERTKRRLFAAWEHMAEKLTWT